MDPTNAEMTRVGPGDGCDSAMTTPPRSISPSWFFSQRSGRNSAVTGHSPVRPPVAGRSQSRRFSVSGSTPLNSELVDPGTAPMTRRRSNSAPEEGESFKRAVTAPQKDLGSPNSPGLRASLTYGLLHRRSSLGKHGVRLPSAHRDPKGLIVVHWSLRAVCAGGVFIGAGAAAPHAQAVRGDEAEPARPDGPQEGPEWAE